MSSRKEKKKKKEVFTWKLYFLLCMFGFIFFHSMYPMHLNFLLYCDVLHVLHVYINLDGVYINKDE